MKARAFFEREAEQEFRRLSPGVAKRILERIRRMTNDVDAQGHEALKGRFRGSFKLRVGNYRVIYRLDRADDGKSASWPLRNLFLTACT